ncbi:MAG: cytochrome c oxidase subunit II [Salinarimonas sp.]
MRYRGEDGAVVPVANELVLPVGRPAVLRLTSPDVIHSFWVPALAGKTDMIPSRETVIVLEPTRTGVFRGACAEYCGASHALMSFAALVMEPADYDAWLARQAAPASPPADPVAERGRAVFLEYGCGACHAIRGTEADGVVGPDLTHVGSRRTLAAGALPNTPDDYVRWISDVHEVKPGARMPAFGMLPEADIAALALYLDGLT